jgi:YfiH family protein
MEILAEGPRFRLLATTVDEPDFAVPKPGATAEHKVRYVKLLKKTLMPQLMGITNLAIAQLRHGPDVEVVSQDGIVFFPNADGLATKRRSQVLCVTGGDCPPICLVDNRSGALALAHSGREGTRENIAAEMVRVLRFAYEVAVEDLHAIIGPRICGACYEIDATTAKPFMEKYPQALQQRGEKFLLSLSTVIRAQLVEAGVPAKNLVVLKECTFEQSERWYSHRRDTREGRKSPRPRVQAFVAVPR